MGRNPAVIFKPFCVGALRGTYHYPDVFVRPVLGTFLRPHVPGTLCKNAMLARVSLRDHLRRVRPPNRQAIEYARGCHLI